MLVEPRSALPASRTVAVSVISTPGRPGKLKFDDLRKVHKDQTIFDVCDSDYSKMKTYSSVEQMSNERHQQNVGPMDKNDAQQLLNQRESQHAEKMIQKQHKSNLKAMEYSEKNKQVMGSLFMRISN